MITWKEDHALIIMRRSRFLSASRIRMELIKWFRGSVPVCTVKRRLVSSIWLLLRASRQMPRLTPGHRRRMFNMQTPEQEPSLSTDLMWHLALSPGSASTTAMSLPEFSLCFRLTSGLLHQRNKTIRLVEGNPGFVDKFHQWWWFQFWCLCTNVHRRRR